MEFFILKPDGEQTGTYSLDQIRSMLNSGFIGPDTRYWHEGIPDWQPIERIEESVDYPEPDPHEPHAPPPHKWSGSLARAIPSPYQQKRSPAAEPKEPKKPATPAVPEPHRAAAEIPISSLRIESQTYSGATPGTTSREAARAVLPRPAPRRGFRLPRPTTAQLYIITSALLALAILAAVIASRHPAHSAFSNVTLLSHNTCVLLNQSDIKPFEDEIHNAPVVTRLKNIIATSTDNGFVQVASNGLQDEIAKHETEVTQKYVQANKAKVIDPGSYDAVAYLDDTGAIVTAHAGAPWVALRLHDTGAIVYAYIGTDFQLRP
jgi:hypothetical protein